MRIWDNLAGLVVSHGNSDNAEGYVRFSERSERIVDPNMLRNPSRALDESSVPALGPQSMRAAGLNSGLNQEY